MSTDIVEKLRETFQRRRYGGDSEYHPDFDLFDVAADEIEKLRNAFASVSRIAGAVSVEGHSYADIRKEIRNAKDA
jgi:hypothetical protein